MLCHEAWHDHHGAVEEVELAQPRFLLLAALS